MNNIGYRECLIEFRNEIDMLNDSVSDIINNFIEKTGLVPELNEVIHILPNSRKYIFKVVL